MDTDLNKCSSAYCTAYSCETVLWKLIEDWKTALDCKKTVGILSTDTSKAFEPLLPPLMLSKLKACNFSEHVLNLIRSYFQHRQGRIKLKEASSFWKEIRKDVLKDRVLGLCYGTYSKMTCSALLAAVNYGETAIAKIFCQKSVKAQKNSKSSPKITLEPNSSSKVISNSRSLA